MSFTDDDPATLELSRETMQRYEASTFARVLDHLANVGKQPPRGDRDAEALCKRMQEDAPEDAADLEPILEMYFREWMPCSLTTNFPGYLAYVPGGGVFPAALADLLSNTTNRFTGTWFGAPALVQLEANALEWIRKWMSFPESASGLFTTGGSMATFNAIVCARERHLGDRIRDGVLYTSTQAHHCVAKSARLAGIRGDRVRSLPVDASFRLRIDALERALAEDRRAGLLPFLVVSSAGTTNSGAVDPLAAIADVCAREGLWHHVDGAYGGFFHACPELRPLLAGIERADSLALDPHKGLFLPYGTGALLVRDGEALRAVHASQAEYMPPKAPSGLYDPSAHGPDLSRGFPGLRVWLTVKLFGARRLRAAIAEKRALAVSAAERIAKLPGIVMLAPPQLSLFAFYVAGRSRDEENARTRSLMDRVAARGRILLSGCTTDHEGAPRSLARVCVLSFRTRKAQIDACVEDIAASIAEMEA